MPEDPPPPVYLVEFERMAAHGGEIVVPDGRAARVLGCALDRAAGATGAPVWRPAAVHTWSAALAWQFESARLDTASEDLQAFVLSNEQELALWEQAIGAEGELDVHGAAQAAPLARTAWRTSHLWDVPAPAATAPAAADVRAYARWAAAYRARARALGAIDGAALLARHRHAAPQPSAPPRRPALAHGFIDPPPRLAAWLAAYAHDAAHHVRPAGSVERFRAHAFVDRAEELYAALEWAAERSAAAPLARVVVAFDGLEQAPDLVRRCCRDVFGSTSACCIGLEDALVRDPVFRAVLLTLDLAPVSRWDTFGEWLRHPALGGAAEEGAARAALDATLRAAERYEVPLAEVRRHLAASGECPRLAAMLDALSASAAQLPRRQRMVAWLAHFEACLQAVGWPGAEPGEPRALRARAGWNAVCDKLYRLDAVLPPLRRGEAVARLRRALTDTAQRGVTPRLGIYMVSPAHAALLDPTHVWLVGCEADLLLGAARPSPLLPIEAQRAAAVPGAEPGRDLWRAQILLERLGARGGEHHASFAAGDGEQRFTPSPLLPALHGAAVRAPQIFVPVRWRQAPVPCERVVDVRGPALARRSAVPGGAGILAAQSACPFRAFARYRLRAHGLDEPRPGLSARARGVLAHRCLAAVWDELETSTHLHRLDAGARRALIERAVSRALAAARGQTTLERAIEAIEHERLVRLLTTWLEFESARGAFAVVEREQERAVEFADLQFRVRIDRIDREADGSRVIVDYKTGRCAASDWNPPRMNAPQLPFYALTEDSGAALAVAFAQLDAWRPQWLQQPAGDAAARAAAWPALRRAWLADLEALAGAIGTGAAAPAPKLGPTTCRNCDQSLFCRLAEHAGAPPDAGADDD